MNILLVGYTAYKVYGMIKHDHNYINHTEVSRDAVSLTEKFKYNDMKASVFFALSNDTYYFTQEEFAPFVTV